MSEEIKVVRTASCPSLSGSSTIKYEIGNLGEEQYIRLSGNSNGGLFCKEWVPLAEIHKILKDVAKPATSTFRELFSGKSSNSPGFLLACLFNEKIVVKDSTPAVSETSPEKKPAKAKKRKTDEER